MIDLDGVIICETCGILFDFRIASTTIENETDYEKTPIYIGRCPNCSQKFKKWNN